MKKQLFGFLILGVLILTSCATAPSGNSDMGIIGKWLWVGGIDRKTGNFFENLHRDGTQTFLEFLPNGNFRMINEVNGEKVGFDTWSWYSIDGNKIYWDSSKKELRSSSKNSKKSLLGEFVLSETNVLTIYNFGGEPSDLATVFNKFDVQINEFTTLERASNIETALENAARVIMVSLPKGRNIAIANVSAEDTDQSDFIANELEFILIKSGFIVVDRSQLDVIRQEQNLQLSGDVADNEIISIGKFSGAHTVITGSISGSGPTRRLRLRLLDIETARVITAASERF